MRKRYSISSIFSLWGTTVKSALPITYNIPKQHKFTPKHNRRQVPQRNVILWTDRAVLGEAQRCLEDHQAMVTTIDYVNKELVDTVDEQAECMEEYATTTTVGN